MVKQEEVILFIDPLFEYRSFLPAGIYVLVAHTNVKSLLIFLHGLLGIRQRFH